ncbi:MAG: hypothetical protein AAFO69_15800, partial [Bacteroidota bacterium]
GQSTQELVGATSKNEQTITHLASELYRKQRLRKAYYSYYIPIATHNRLPFLSTTPLLSKNHLYSIKTTQKSRTHTKMTREHLWKVNANYYRAKQSIRLSEQHKPHSFVYGSSLQNHDLWKNVSPENVSPENVSAKSILLRHKKRYIPATNCANVAQLKLFNHENRLQV